jgi:hypothetical protein
VNEYLLGTTGQCNVGVGQDFCAAIWFRWVGPNESFGKGIFAKHNGINGERHWMMNIKGGLETGTGRLLWRIGDGSGSNFKFYETASQGLPTDGEWHHAAMIWNADAGGGTLRCFFDGAEFTVGNGLLVIARDDSFNQMAATTNTVLRVGAFGNGDVGRTPRGFFPGDLTQACVFSNTLFTAADVAELYNQYPSGAGPKFATLPQNHSKSAFLISAFDFLDPSDDMTGSSGSIADTGTDATDITPQNTEAGDLITV